MSLSTPERIRDLRGKLYAKAKREPGYRFYSLYDKIVRRDVLEHAFRLAESNRGAAGADGETFTEIGSAGVSEWLSRLQEELLTGTYRPQAVRRVNIPKPGGGERPLGIPTIRDRVVQTAAALVLSAIFEAEFDDALFGYRPQRSAHDALRAVHTTLRQGATEVVDADLSLYFDTIPHTELLRCVARRVADGAVLRLLHMWLKAPVQETDGEGRVRHSGGRGSNRGVPQGGPLSPLLSNVYMNRFLRHWRRQDMERRMQAKVVAYADDFVICCRRSAADVLSTVRRWMASLKLSLNEGKTRVCDARREHFDFLGYTFGPMVHRPTGRTWLGMRPSRKAVSRLRARVREILRPGNHDPWPKVASAVNLAVRGWANYFSLGTVSRAWWWMDKWLWEKVRRFLVRRHKLPGRGTRRFPAEEVFGTLGITRLGRMRRPANALV